MRIVNEEIPVSDRLSDEELIALRARLRESHPDSGPTVDSVAEVLGKSREEVLAHLERLRAERAFSETDRRSYTASIQTQRRLLLFAIALFSVAGAIYKFTPRPVTEAEMEAMLKETLARRAKRPKRVVYPIKTTLKQTESNQTGLPLRIVGLLTETESVIPGKVFAISIEELQRHHRENFIKVYEAARDAEDAAPKPAKPIPVKPDALWQFGGLRPSNEMFLASGIARAEIPRHLSGNELLTFAETATDGFAKTLWKQQADQFRFCADTPRDASGMSPISITLDAKQFVMSTGGTGGALVFPQDPVTVRKALFNAVRGGIARVQANRNDPNPSPAALHYRDYSAVDVTLQLPGEPLRVHVPLTAKDGFKNAADARRAGERALKKMAEQIEDRIRVLNRATKQP